MKIKAGQLWYCNETNEINLVTEKNYFIDTGEEVDPEHWIPTPFSNLVFVYIGELDDPRLILPKSKADIEE